MKNKAIVTYVDFFKLDTKKKGNESLTSLVGPSVVNNNNNIDLLAIWKHFVYIIEYPINVYER